MSSREGRGMLASMPSITAQPGAQPERPTAMLLGTRRAARAGAGLALRWASVVCRLNLESFFECTDARQPNRLLCASAGSVCVTALPARISSQGRCAQGRASDHGSRDASHGFVVLRAVVVSCRRCALVKVALC